MIFGTIVVPFKAEIKWDNETLHWDWECATKSLHGVDAFIQSIIINRELNEVEIRFYVSEGGDITFTEWINPWFESFDNAGIWEDSHADIKV